jgi:hypothetical protein
MPRQNNRRFLIGSIAGLLLTGATQGAQAQTTPPTDPGTLACPETENTSELPYYYSKERIYVLKKSFIQGNNCVKCQSVSAVAMPQTAYTMKRSRTRDQNMNFGFEIAGLFKFIVGSQDANTFKNEAGFTNGSKLDYEESGQYPAPNTPPDLWPRVACDHVGQYYQRESHFEEWEKRWSGTGTPPQNSPKRIHTIYNLSAINFVTWNPKVETFNFCTQQKEPLPTSPTCPDGSTPTTGPDCTEEPCMAVQ